MNAKEKAKELVKKFIPCVPGWDCYHDSPRDENDILTDAKRCALIAVDEIILNGFNPHLSYNYWQEVRAEIENL